jgi:hypothetical protein
MTEERETADSTAADPPPPDTEPPSNAPPPLAPLVDPGAVAASNQGEDTTVQPAGTWQSAGPPSVPPPAMLTPAVSTLAPQPAVSWAPAPAPVAARGQRTTVSLVAGILLVIGGILGGLAGLLVAAFGDSIVDMIENVRPMPDLEGMDPATFLSGVVVFIGIIVLVYSLVYLIAGIGVIRSRDWGRVLGLIVGILSGLIWLSGLGGAGRAGGGDNIVVTLILLGIHVYIVVALLFFWRAKSSTA